MVVFPTSLNSADHRVRSQDLVGLPPERCGSHQAACRRAFSCAAARVSAAVGEALGCGACFCRPDNCVSAFCKLSLNVCASSCAAILLSEAAATSAKHAASAAA